MLNSYLEWSPEAETAATEQKRLEAEAKRQQMEDEVAARTAVMQQYTPTGTQGRMTPLAAARAAQNGKTTSDETDTETTDEQIAEDRAAEESLNTDDGTVTQDEINAALAALNGETVTSTPTTSENGGGEETVSYTPPPQEEEAPSEPAEMPSGTDILNEATAQATLNEQQKNYLAKQQAYVNAVKAQQGLLGQLSKPQQTVPYFNSNGQFGNAYGRTDLPSDQFFAQQYNALRNAGLSDRRAKREAARRAGDYRLQRISDIGSAFGSYGLNKDGSVNLLGTQLIQAMGQEDADRANVMHSLYPGLLNSYKTSADAAKAQANNEAKLAIEQYRQDRADRRTAENNAVRMAIAQMKGNNNGTGNGLSRNNLLNYYYGEYMNNVDGATQEDAINYAYAQVNGLRNAGKPANEPKVTESVRQARQGVVNLLVAANNAVDNSSAEESGDAIEEARAAIDDAEHNGKLDADDAAEARLRLDYIANKREVKAGYKPKW